MRHGSLQRLEQIAVVQTVHQVHDDFGVGLAVEHVTLGLQRGAQLIVVFDDAVVHQRDLAGLLGSSARAVAEVRVCVVHRRCTVGGPAGVGNTGAAGQMVCVHLRLQLGHTRCAARTLQPVGIHRHATRVIPPVLQPLQALHQDGNDVSGRDGCDDATHKSCS